MFSFYSLLLSFIHSVIIKFSFLFFYECRVIELPDTFDLSLWRLIITGGYGNQTLCKAPDNYRSIVDDYCHTQNIDWICRKSPALELFSNPDRKLSIRAEASTLLTVELYSQALAPYDDEETSK